MNAHLQRSARSLSLCLPPVASRAYSADVGPAMRVPSLPIVIDEFPALNGNRRSSSSTGVGSAAGDPELFFLSHFHTDHMKGLSSNWTAGAIITGILTRELLLSKFEGLRGRVLGLPFWCRTPVLSAAGTVHSTSDSSATTAVSVVYVTLLPAFHIPGSAMFFLETPSGVTYLHTGDFKYTEAVAQASPLRTFFQSHRVDHLYLDDTWLHLGHAELTSWPAHTDGTPIGSRGAGVVDSGIRVLSKLLDADQVEEAIEAIGRRMDHQRQLHAQWVLQQSHTDHNDTAEALRTSSSSSASAELSNARLPFVVRVYLHNQFGKEMLVQQLATRLRTRALIDDVRYARLLTVVETLEEERDDLRAFEGESPARLDGTAPPLSVEELAWRASGGEAAHYPYNLNCFVSFSQAQHQQVPLTSLSDGGGAMLPQQLQLSANRSVERTYEPPLIEVVSSRASIEPATLQAASAARGGTPYYGVIISGWARLQSQTHGSAASGQVWHVPTTLHSTPQEIINFVALLRPLSATPLHYRHSRGDVVMQRLGPYLRIPFVNHHSTGCDTAAPTTTGSGAIALKGGAVRWMPYLPTHVLLLQVGSRDSQGGLGTSALFEMPAARDAAARCGDGLDSLEEKPRRGFRIGPAGLPPPSSRAMEGAPWWGGGVPVDCDALATVITTSYFFAPTCLSAMPFSGKGEAYVCGKAKNPAGTSVSSSASADGLRMPSLLPSWRLRRLTQSYLNMQPPGGKRERVDGETDGPSSITHRAERHTATAMKTEPAEKNPKTGGDSDKGCPAASLTSSATSRLLSLSDIAESLLA
ncbi:hypothetical protein LPMP_131350 [Leishmania panamensis]|uniref:DNA repair metallo-beta-lactamase domain-containing protein n=1 Tax=Leishmania panamensis TaxID=5679 RepID=A0A088RKL6_LEIPA|nr:hypothetical protein LPMP_131350 [Leishmania panamensis]AIN96562.1 hypothetical protein LPMP_131350 [Leishmania panamensis]